MGYAIPKVLIEVHGKTIIEHTISRLSASSLIAKIIILAPPHLLEQFASFEFASNVAIIPGGETRKLSVSAGLSHIAQVEPDTNFVLIHDGARCCVSPSLIERCINESFRHKAVTAAIPVVDSLKEVGEDRKVIQSLNRAAIRAIQTPQVFAIELLLRAHEQGGNDATDDASLVEKTAPVYVVEGEPSNLKVTTPFDLKLAQLLLNDG